MIKKKILIENYPKYLSVLFRTNPFFLFKDGIFSSIERTIYKFPDSQIDIHIDKTKYKDKFLDFYKSSFKNNITFIQSTILNESTNFVQDLFTNYIKNLLEDISYINIPKIQKKNFLIKGNKEDIFIHPSAQISTFSEFDTTNGPIIIDENSSISSFSILKGPLYIGKKSYLKKCYINNSRVGNNCNIGGEVQNSFIGDFTNKAHQGFIGHSIIGNWVNLGAMTTTSNLKNNYNNISLEYGKYIFNTKSIKFGSIISDYVKTGIGTLLNTGTIIDIGTNIFLDYRVKKYYPPFFWGGKKESIYEIEKFINTTRNIMKRKNIKLMQTLEDQIRYIYKIRHNIISF